MNTLEFLLVIVIVPLIVLLLITAFMVDTLRSYRHLPHYQVWWRRMLPLAIVNLAAYSMVGAYGWLSTAKGGFLALLFSAPIFAMLAGPAIGMQLSILLTFPRNSGAHQIADFYGRTPPALIAFTAFQILFVLAILVTVAWFSTR